MQKKGSSRILSFAALLIILSAFACKKPAHIGKSDLSEEMSAIVFATSLSDTLPQKTLEQLKVTDAMGIKIASTNGTYVSYFEYKAEPCNVVKALTNLAFSKAAVLADTTCRRIPNKNLDELKSQVSLLEVEHSDFFWTANSGGMEAFECIKPPFKHTLIVDKNSTRIFHRIEFLG